jgi:hypothetical protein
MQVKTEEPPINALLRPQERRTANTKKITIGGKSYAKINNLFKKG